VIESGDEWYRYPDDRPPNHNGPVWAYLPALGNDDDGYGMVIVARWIGPGASVDRGLGPQMHAPGWMDAHGLWLDADDERVTHWRFLYPPEPPFPVTETMPDLTKLDSLRSKA